MASCVEQSLDALGFRQLLELIAGYAHSQLGKQAIYQIHPHADVEHILAGRGLYGDMLLMLQSTHALPGLHIPDLSEILTAVNVTGAMLSCEELLLCRTHLEIAQAVLLFSQENDISALKHFSRLASQIEPCTPLLNQLLRVLDRDGTILDNATEDLRSIRRQQRDTERHIQQALEGLVHSDEYASILQDHFVTKRNGRYVIPVRKEAQSNCHGLVHDVSSSGQTLFMEPVQTIGLGNQLTSLAAAEREELRRIVAELSAMVHNCREALRVNQELLARMDAAAAVSRWAADYNCTLPAFGAALKLHNARHPLLLAQFRAQGAGRRVVPLELELPEHTTTLAVTGSNTGGKTVALKTVGLLTLAALSSLPVPASAESQFVFFRHVLADIGDGQSLADNLSTFSGHIANVAAIMRQCAESQSLVLMDELGSGTDPQEGGALACALLEELQRLHACTIITTHLGTVKKYVQGHRNMVNASVRFNAQTLAPEYILDIGQPGASHALHIARRLGVPLPIIRNAERYMDDDALHLEKMLTKMEREQRQLAERNAEAEAARQQILRQRDELSAQLDELKRQRKQMMNDAYQRAEAMVDNTRRDLENLLRAIREKARRNSSGIDADLDAGAIAAIRHELSQRGNAIAQGLKQTMPQPKMAPLPLPQLTVGKKVFLERFNAHGRILHVDERARRVTVELNGVPFVMKCSELLPSQEPESAVRETAVTIQMPRFQGQTCHEINLVGERVESAISRLNTYLNECAVAGLAEVRVVHGFGSGRLREGIRQWLLKQRFIKSFRLGIDQKDEGGGGVTFVQLK